MLAVSFWEQRLVDRCLRRWAAYPRALAAIADECAAVSRCVCTMRYTTCVLWEKHALSCRLVSSTHDAKSTKSSQQEVRSREDEFGHSSTKQL